jgi:phosphatidylglycerol:prolipoprotein diacylglycerol transferase
VVVAAITIGMDPVISRLGPLELRWYGLIIVSGLLVGTAVAAREAPRRGLRSEDVWMALLLVLPLAVLGARLFHILDNLDTYTAHPDRILTLQLKGLAIYGALSGGMVGAWLWARLKHIPTLRLLDVAAVGIPVGQLVGKFANVINGDTWGNETSLPWGFVYTHPDTLLPDRLLGVPTHPTPVYEQLWLIVVIAVIFLVKDRLKMDGLVIMLYLLLYSSGRFFVSVFRVNNPLLFGLKEAQLIALGAVLVLLPVFLWRLRQQRNLPGAEASVPGKADSRALGAPSRKGTRKGGVKRGRRR